MLEQKQLTFRVFVCEDVVCLVVLFVLMKPVKPFLFVQSINVERRLFGFMLVTLMYTVIWLGSFSFIFDRPTFVLMLDAIILLSVIWALLLDIWCAERLLCFCANPISSPYQRIISGQTWLN